MMLKNVIVDLLLLVGCRHFSGTFYVNNDLSALYGGRSSKQSNHFIIK